MALIPPLLVCPLRRWRAPSLIGEVKADAGSVANDAFASPSPMSWALPDVYGLVPIQGPGSVTIWGPLRRADLPGLYARVCRTLEAHAGSPVVCDVASVASDAIAVEALCRLRLGAKRHRCEIRLRGAADELLELVAYLGLGDVLRAELAVELER